MKNRLAVFGFALAVAAGCVTVFQAAYFGGWPGQGGLAAAIGTFILLAGALVVEWRVAANGIQGRTSAVVAIVGAACVLFAFSYVLLFWQGPEVENAFGLAFFILVGYPTLLIGSLLAWLYATGFISDEDRR